MARLGKPYKPELFDCMRNDNIDDYWKKCDAELDKIRDKTISFPIADGKAIYLVESLNPLVLRHVPFGDAWQIPEAHIRGLRRADVEKALKLTMLLRPMKLEKP